MINTNLESIKSIYFIAICGTGMAALAGMFKSQGRHVSGSDQNVYPPMSTFLADLKIPVHQRFDESHLDPAPDLVVIGNTISRGNSEVETVLEKKIPYVSLPQALREFFIRGHYSCVVAGTHGKTSTSSLLAWILEKAGRDPSFFIGGIPENFGSGYKLGKGEVFVSEGDEYDSAFFDKGAKFYHYMPDLVILNHVEFDHADIFENFDDVKRTFSRLINLIPGNGYLISCWDDPTVKQLSGKAFSKLVTFGFDNDADWRPENIRVENDMSHFDVIHKGEKFGNFSISLYGKHAIRNCLAVVAASSLLGLAPGEIRDGFETFKSVQRRLQLKGQANGITVFDDFAHHPTEVQTTIEGLKQRYPDRKVWAVFEPRSATSKRRIFADKFVEALSEADKVILTPLYMGEKVPEQERLSVEDVSAGLKKNGIANWILPPNTEMVSFLKQNLRSNEVVLFMSNGEFHQIPEKLLEALN